MMGIMDEIIAFSTSSNRKDIKPCSWNSAGASPNDVSIEQQDRVIQLLM
jgi:hypothetical protein